MGPFLTNTYRWYIDKYIDRQIDRQIDIFMDNQAIKPGMGKKGRVMSNPHSKIDPIMPGH